MLLRDLNIQRFAGQKFRDTRSNIIAYLTKEIQLLFCGASCFRGVGKAEVRAPTLAQADRAVFGGNVAQGDDQVERPALNNRHELGFAGMLDAQFG